MTPPRDYTAGLLVLAGILLWMAFAAAAGATFGPVVAVALAVLCAAAGVAGVVRG